MLKEAIYHRPKGQFAYPDRDGSFHIQLRTKRQDVQSVTLVYGDPFEFDQGHWKYTSAQMEQSGTDGLFDYWFIVIFPPQKRLRYAFYLKSSEEELFFTEKGFSDHVHPDFSAYFCLPYHHCSDAYNAPEWVKTTVWYQIFPDRFANGDPSNDPPVTLPWNSIKPTSDSIFGGDLQGVIQHLDYLVDLGINGIYFTPLFKANSNHKYDTVNYFEIDPQFGSLQDMKEVVAQCHARGIRVMLDAVFNHCGLDFPPFQDVLEHGEASQYIDWFHISFTPSGDIHYETFSFEKSMPKLNTQHPEVRKYLFEVGEYWIRECHIDGWRLDVANEIDHQFWKDFRQAMKAIHSEVYLVGEVWHDAKPWLEGDQFDAVMNYPLANLLHQFFAYDVINAQQFTFELQKFLHQYPKPVYHSLFNMVGSHDTPRILNLAKMNKQKVKLLSVFQFCFFGSPSIYYGDEIGLTGDQDPGCRGCMEWDSSNQDQDILVFMKKLIHLRKQYPILGNEGQFRILSFDENKNSLCFQRENNKELVIVVINNHPESQTVQLPLQLKDRTILDLWKSEEFAAHSDQLSVTLSGYDFSLLYIKK
ncbi:MAG TPA: alpha-glycosidase [Metabacillus sp.]|nr:alpha-glycosidase [Metabacillus sp.]